MLEEIRLFRIKNNISQEKLADMVNVSRSTIQRWEKGLSKPSCQELESLANVLKISKEQLLYGIDQSNNSADRYSSEFSVLSERIIEIGSCVAEIQNRIEVSDQKKTSELDELKKIIELEKKRQKQYRTINLIFLIVFFCITSILIGIYLYALRNFGLKGEIAYEGNPVIIESSEE